MWFTTTWSRRHFLAQFSQIYTDRYTTDWGQAINYEDEHAGPGASFSWPNAGTGSRNFTATGLRLDDTQKFTTPLRIIFYGHSPPRRHAAPDAPPFCSRETNAAHDWSAHRSAVGMAWTRSGTMTSTTVLWWRSHGHRAAY